MLPGISSIARPILVALLHGQAARKTFRDEGGGYQSWLKEGEGPMCKAQWGEAGGHVTVLEVYASIPTRTAHNWWCGMKAQLDILAMCVHLGAFCMKVTLFDPCHHETCLIHTSKFLGRKHNSQQVSKRGEK